MKYSILGLLFLSSVTCAESEVMCLAKNIYHEARGESIDGQLAVAFVTVNRARSNKFPNTVCGVVYQAKHSRWWKEKFNKLVPLRNKCQFSWYCDGRSDEIRDLRAWEVSVSVAQLVLHDEVEDITNGAVFYYNPAKANPHWKSSFKRVALVDNHVFLK
jgi:N-acetylmuramoyl-L-alanine amidase